MICFTPPKCVGKFVRFVLLTAALTYCILRDGRPVSCTHRFRAKGGPRFPKGAPISRWNGAGGGPYPWGPQNFMTPAPDPRFTCISYHSLWSESAKSLSRLLKAEYTHSLDITVCTAWLHSYLHSVERVLVTVVFSPLYSMAQATPQQLLVLRMCYKGVPDCVGTPTPLWDCCFGFGSSYRDLPDPTCHNW